MADVAIAGAGPAGATLAVLLGRAGLTVDVFDARRFPREKPCGEGIMPAGVAVLERLGLIDAVGGRRVDGVRYHGFGGTAESGFPAAAGAAAPAMLAQRRL
ncbi:MAG: monooxygenase, FAD-binding protein, partial [Myxococcales bacterium]|nr:monooxygenase, FAD-binding protein [Myxococcales bacterium]